MRVGRPFCSRKKRRRGRQLPRRRWERTAHKLEILRLLPVSFLNKAEVASCGCGRVVYDAGLENRCGREVAVGSNPTARANVLHIYGRMQVGHRNCWVSSNHAHYTGVAQLVEQRADNA